MWAAAIVAATVVGEIEARKRREEARKCVYCKGKHDKRYCPNCGAPSAAQAKILHQTQ